MKNKGKSRLDGLVANERAANIEGRGSWSLYATHRTRLTAAILDLPPGDGRIALLGAGNCNDLDLAGIAASYRDVHLVDVDAAALAGAIARCDPTVRARLHPHAPVDLSALMAVLDRLPRPSPE